MDRIQECFCIDVGGTFIKYARIDENREFSNKGKVPTPYEGVGEYLDCLTDLYRRYSADAKGISMSVPGFIDDENGICVTAGSLQYADGLHLAEELSKRCGVPVRIMNDARAAAEAEVTWGALRDVKSGIVLVLGTGVGGALISDRKVLRGAHFSAGEFSYVGMGGDVDRLENEFWTRCGNGRLVRMVSQIKNLSPENVTGEDIFRWIKEGDSEVERALDQFTADIARFIMNLQFIFDPERIAIGGGISCQPKLLESIQKNLDFNYSVFPFSVPKADITVCHFHNDANLLGAYSHFQRKAGEII